MNVATGQTNARNVRRSSRCAPIQFDSQFAPDPDLDRTARSIPVRYRRTFPSANTRKCSFGFLCRASGNDVSSQRLVSDPFLPPPLPLPPLGVPCSEISFSLSLSALSLLASSLLLHLSLRRFFLFVRVTRALPPTRGRKPKPIYLHLLSASFSYAFGYRSPFRYVKPLGDIFSRRSSRKKKPNISWRQIVIGACTTGIIPLSTSRSLVVGERIRPGMTIADKG